MKIRRREFEVGPLEIQAFSFIPQESKKDMIALLSHGFTASKSSILSWATRFAEEGIPSLLIGQPGHYLDSFNDVHKFEHFNQFAHQVFSHGLDLMRDLIKVNPQTHLLLGGHSLGSLLALKAMSDSPFENFSKTCLCVGLGVEDKNSEETHIFNSQFYKKTMQVRRQLVSPALNPTDMFAWIKKEKHQLKLSGEKILMLCGEDDVVVGRGGAERMRDVLVELGNEVILEQPKTLPHHVPEKAAPHLYSMIRKNLAF